MYLKLIMITLIIVLSSIVSSLPSTPMEQLLRDLEHSRNCRVRYSTAYQEWYIKLTNKNGKIILINKLISKNTARLYSRCNRKYK